MVGGGRVGPGKRMTHQCQQEEARTGGTEWSLSGKTRKSGSQSGRSSNENRYGKKVYPTKNGWGDFGRKGQGLWAKKTEHAKQYRSRVEDAEVSKVRLAGKATLF